MSLRCLVIGGTGAIGSAVVRTLAREGAKVAFTFFNRSEAAAKLAGELNAHRASSIALPIRCDLKDSETISRCVEQCGFSLGGMDALIFASGITPREELSRISPEIFDETMAVNVRGPLLASQSATAWLKRNPNGGNIVFLGALPGIKPIPAPALFAASKAALRGLVESLARELESHKIRVNNVAPGWLTEGSSSSLSEKDLDHYLRHCPLGHCATAREIAEVVSEIALRNTAITGQSIVLDGGYSD